MGDKAASPSPAVSSAKTRRLDALHRRLGGKRAGAAQQPGSPSAGLPNKRHKASSAGATPSPRKQGPAKFPYDLLDHVRFDATLARRLQGPSAHKDATTAFLDGLLASTATDSTGVQNIKQRVQDRMLQLDNPATIKAAAIKAAKAKQRSQHKRMSTAPRAESAAVARAHAKELSRLPKDQQRYELYQPLNVLWQAYAGKLLQSPTMEALLQADLHGCQLTVLASKVGRHVGKQGIVVQDRSNILVVITPDNQQLLLAKQGAKFRVQLDPLHAMILNGDAWRAH
jgi:ribonuclease P protein subunit POP4